jgi:hypothetical protein
VTCWLWNLLTGDVELVARAVCHWIPPVADTFLNDPMWRPPLPLDRYVA